MPAAEPVAPGLFQLEKVLPTGWCLSMHVVALPGGGALVYSPTWCGDGTFEAVDAIGEVRAIVAPNHYHHLSLARFRARYPGAIVAAAPAARSRLARKGHEGLAELDEVAALLPPGARVIACEEMKNGEAWLLVPSPDGPVLVVCDGFFHVTRPVRGLMGWALRRMRVVPELCFGWTTKRLVVADRDAFLAWTTGFLERERPAVLAPSHGAPLRDPDLAGRLTALLRERLA